VFSAEGRLKLMQTRQGRALLIMATTAVLDRLGTKVRAEVGLSFPKLFDTSFFIEGCVDPQCMQVTDGSERQVGGAARVRALSDHLTFGTSGSYSLDSGVPSLFINSAVNF
jgi:hypothetical protein